MHGPINLKKAFIVLIPFLYYILTGPRAIPVLLQYFRKFRSYRMLRLRLLPPKLGQLLRVKTYLRFR